MSERHTGQPVDSRALFSLWALFWLLMFAISLQENLHEPGIRWWQPLLWEGSSCLVATAWLLLQRRRWRHWNQYLDRPLRWFGIHLAWMPVVAITFVIAVYAIRHGVYALRGLTYTHDPWPRVFVYESIKLLLFAGLWLSIIFGLSSFTRWREERERLLVLQKTLAESQLAQLRAQLQPHFLFNALNTISSLMQVDVERADRLLTQLADLLRASLGSGAQNMTSLRGELELLKLYAAIMQERFAGRVTLEWRIAPETLDAAVPAMLLQPLLENAYKHGVERSSQPGAIRVAARRDGEDLLVDIHNTGTLSSPAADGIGLRNSRERLERLYGMRAALQLTADAQDVWASVRLPFLTQEVIHE